MEVNYELYFKIFKQFGVSYDWSTIYIGVKMNLIEISEISNFACEILQNETMSTGILIDLAWGINEQERNQVLNKIVIEFGLDNLKENSPKWREEVRKWRCCILRYIRQNIMNEEELFEKVIELYSILKYPEDMKEFIPYMPIEGDYNPLVHTKKENVNRLIGLLDNFIENEYIKVKK